MLEHVSSMGIAAVQTNKTTRDRNENKLGQNALKKFNQRFLVSATCHPDVSSEIKAGMFSNGVNVFVV